MDSQHNAYHLWWQQHAGSKRAFGLDTWGLRRSSSVLPSWEKPHGFKTKHRMANKLLRINGLALSKVLCHVDWDAMWECSYSCQLEMTCCKRWDYGDKEPCSLDPCFVNPALPATVLEHPLPPGCLPGACTIRSFLQMPELSPEPVSTIY